MIKNNKKANFDLISGLLFVLVVMALNSGCFAEEKQLKNDYYQIRLATNGAVEIAERDGGSWVFEPVFTVLYSARNPELALRPSGLNGLGYDCVSWLVAESKASSLSQLKKVEKKATQGGDGFDDRITKGGIEGRTADLFDAAMTIRVKAKNAIFTDRGIFWNFDEHPLFAIKAKLVLGEAEPVLKFSFKSRKKGYYSVGYSGAPEFDIEQLEEIYQPMFWQEKRFPEISYMALAFRCPIPATFINKSGITIGVVVDPEEFGFQPLPRRDNNRFGVAVRNADGLAQPMVFAPVLGGPGSEMKPSDVFSFKMRLFISRENCASAFEAVARRIYGFKDMRTNSICSLNETIENEIEYGLSKFSRFNDELKGCSYDTDVPGSVKNVSALNPLMMAMITDNAEIFEKRAYPIMEFLMSREKLLFCLDPKQKIQAPSRKIDGPCANVTELAALYEITQKADSVFLKLAEEKYEVAKIGHSRKMSKPSDWKNILALYRITGKQEYLRKAMEGADAYIESRFGEAKKDFKSPSGSFWYFFTPSWTDLFVLYEQTGKSRYLNAAWKGAREYAMYSWMCPAVPKGDIVVNAEGKAPLYWYLEGKGHKQMFFPEEKVPAWRLSEIGLLPESLRTSIGHRGVFMANHATWMLKIGYLKDDQFLREIARNAIIGRSSNFPGYHINTDRTTAYEKKDYPLRPHIELSVNSFHYNHIWPHISMLTNYLITDAFVRSQGRIDFPSQFIEGYVYLYDKFYGHKSGSFYGVDDAYLWMPKDLLNVNSVEINYIAARSPGKLHIALMNQSRDKLPITVSINPDIAGFDKNGKYDIEVWKDNELANTMNLADGSVELTVEAMGITALTIDSMDIKPKFQQKILSLSKDKKWKKDFAVLDEGKIRAMVLNFGRGLARGYVYLTQNDAAVKKARLEFSVDGKKWQALMDGNYPFEFTVEIPDNSERFDFRCVYTGVDGREVVSEDAFLIK